MKGNVPVSSSGGASFDVNAIPEGSGDPAISTNAVKPDELKLDSCTWHYEKMEDVGTLHWSGTLAWTAQAGGFEHDGFSPNAGWYASDSTIAPDGRMTLTHYTDNNVEDYYTTNSGMANLPWSYGVLAGLTYLHAPKGSNYLFSSFYNKGTAKVVYHTGGKQPAGSQSVYAVSGAYLTEEQEEPSQQGIFSGDGIVSADVPPPQPVVVGFGESLGADRTAYQVLPNPPQVEETLKANVPQANFIEQGARYQPYINLTTSTTNVSLATNTPEVCVGQLVTFALNGLPTGSISNMVGNWQLPDKFVNESWQETQSIVDPATGVGTTVPYGSVNYRINSSLLANTNQTACWFYNTNNGHVSVGLNLQFNNGQYASVAAKGDFTVFRPSVNQPDPSGPFHAALMGSMTPTLQLANNDMDFTVTINSKYSGSFGLTQLVKMYSETIFLPPDLLQGATTWGNFNLDINPGGSTGEYYDGPKDISISCRINDAPGQPLIFIMGDYTGHWKDYVRFTPKDGIPVTLGRIDWNWAATAFDDQASWWTITSDGADGPTLHVDDSFPLWKSEGITQFPIP